MTTRDRRHRLQPQPDILGQQRTGAVRGPCAIGQVGSNTKRLTKTKSSTQYSVEQVKAVIVSITLKWSQLCPDSQVVGKNLS